MPDAFIETLRSWQNFYFMTGGAAATLLGLMFVAMSLGINLVTEENREEIKTFVNPSVFYFTSAFIICGAMLVPFYTPSALMLILLVGGGLGFSRVLVFARRLIRAALTYQDFDPLEWLTQVILPVAAYALIVIAALCYGGQEWRVGFVLLAAAIMMLLVSAIGNTWSLVMWIIHQRQ
ncbi:MAG: hypothetical protein SF029_14250 [bacterium]|nr:hypothetical protein [bacterium]